MRESQNSPPHDAGNVADWWANNPMTYAEVHGATTFGGQQTLLGDKTFFEEADKRFFEWNQPLHGAAPFDRLFPFAAYGPGAKVLEIGCGMGCMAGLWAARGVAMTAVDLNPTAVTQTRRRFDLFRLGGEVVRVDGRDLPFADGAFDYVYSWGVLHHSPRLQASLAQMMRVLKPGGGFGLMLYHRHSLWHAYMTEYIEGFLHAERWFLDDLALASRYGDAQREEGNPHTWPVTRQETSQMLGPFCRELKFRVLGTELDGALRLLLPGLGAALPRWAKKPWARRWGWSLWAEGVRR